MKINLLSILITSDMLKQRGNNEFLLLLVKGLTVLFFITILMGIFFIILGGIRLIYQMRHERDEKKIGKGINNITLGVMALLYGTWGYVITVTPEVTSVFYHKLWMLALYLIVGFGILILIKHLMPEFIKKMLFRQKKDSSRDTKGDNSEN